MNSKLLEYARKTLKEDLLKCTESQVLLFKRMYSHNNLNKDISSIVDMMNEEKLDHAMTQVQRTIYKNNK